MNEKVLDLSGEVALITGSSRGIGKSIARTLAHAGASVVISSRKIEACEAVAAELKQEGHKAIAVACNTSDSEQVRGLAQQVLQSLGPISILICNASINPAYGPLSKIDRQLFEKTMSVNVTSTLQLINLVSPGMAKRGGGSIVIISSFVPFFGSRTIGAYAASKAATMQLARNFAAELGADNIRVNAIAPGLIRTDFSTAIWNTPAGRDFAARTPLKRLGEACDVAGVALFLASDLARFVTGQVVIVDGGALIADPF